MANRLKVNGTSIWNCSNYSSLRVREYAQYDLVFVGGSDFRTARRIDWTERVNLTSATVTRDWQAGHDFHQRKRTLYSAYSEETVFCKRHTIGR